MSIALQWIVRPVCVVLAVVSILSSGTLGAAELESFPADSPRWQLGPKAQVTEYLGRHCLNLEDEKATLRDFEISDGVIDVDMAGIETRGFYNRYWDKEDRYLKGASPSTLTRQDLSRLRSSSS
jgi:hypothetical protein